MIRWCLLLLALCVGCAQQSAAPVAERATTAERATLAEPAPEPLPTAVAPSPMDAWLTRVVEAHRLTDAADDGQGIDAAVSALTSAFADAPDRLDAAPVRQDLAGRLAALERRRARPAAAAEWARKGLTVMAERSVFTVRLHDELARALAALGQDAQAAAARREARKTSTLLQRR